MITTQQTKKFDLPENHEPFTDKYFLRSKDILKQENLNPEIAVKIFARGEGEIAGIDEATAIVDKYSENDETELHVTEADEFETKDPLMVLKGPAQDIVDIETMYLGALSHGLTETTPITKQLILKSLEQP